VDPAAATNRAAAAADPSQRNRVPAYVVFFSAVGGCLLFLIIFIR
jgi:hypothetical protein